MSFIIFSIRIVFDFFQSDSKNKTKKTDEFLKGVLDRIYCDKVNQWSVWMWKIYDLPHKNLSALKDKAEVQKSVMPVNKR